MKKLSIVAVVLALALLLLPATALALSGETDVASVSLTDSGLNLSADVQNGTEMSAAGQIVNTVAVTLTLTKDKINTILAQSPGSAQADAPRGNFFYTLTVTFEDTFAGGAYGTVMNANFANGTDLDAAIASVDAQYETDDYMADMSSDTISAWPAAVEIQYRTGADQPWKTMEGRTSGGKTIATMIQEAITAAGGGSVTVDSTTYGTYYRFAMPTDYYTLFSYRAYDDADRSNQVGNTEYVKITYTVEYPIAGVSNDGQQAWYPDLDSAIAAGETEININDDLTLDSATEIPAGVTVNVKSGAVLNTGDNLTNNGTLNNEGTVSGKLTNTGTVVNEGTMSGDVTNNGNLYSDNAVNVVAGNPAQPLANQNQGNQENQGNQGYNPEPDAEFYDPTASEDNASDSTGDVDNPGTGAGRGLGLGVMALAVSAAAIVCLRRRVK